MVPWTRLNIRFYVHYLVLFSFSRRFLCVRKLYHMWNMLLDTVSILCQYGTSRFLIVAARYCLNFVPIWHITLSDRSSCLEDFVLFVTSSTNKIGLIFWRHFWITSYLAHVSHLYEDTHCDWRPHDLNDKQWGGGGGGTGEMALGKKQATGREMNGDWANLK
jgi:hypothetical protein